MCSNAYQVYKKSIKMNEIREKEARKEAQAFLQTELLEKQAKTGEDLKEITQQNIESSNIQYKTSQMQFYISIILSFLALMISIVFAIRSEVSSKNWQAEQTKLLHKQIELMSNK